MSTGTGANAVSISTSCSFCTCFQPSNHGSTIASGSNRFAITASTW